jgi:DNA end-binding protein Ku
MGAIDELEHVPAKVKPDEVKLAKQVMSTFEAPLEMRDFTDEYQAELRKVIDAKIEGREVAEPVEEEAPKVVNLMEALRKSLDTVSKAKKKPIPVELEKQRAAGGAKRRAR